jgi:predicted nuclease of restriction endonuclease-like (RecB) superfamily
MARGWESKSVESQVESAREERPSTHAARNEKEKLVLREQQNLMLSRAYVERQLEAASNELYVQSLQKALAEIDQKLAILEREMQGL